MPEPSHDPSVFREPHMRPAPPPAPPLAQPPMMQPRPVMPYASPDTPDARDHDPNQDVRFEPIYSGQPAQPPPAGVEHSVWDEPGMSSQLTGRPSGDQPAYAAWLTEQQSRWTAGRSWLLTFAVALLAGPMAVVGAFWGSGQTVFSALMLVVFGPVTEELMKVAGPALLVEKYPWVFRSGWQIMLCALCGGLAFASIENLLYLHVYIANPSPQIIRWRWTACLALHAACSLIAGLGVLRAWRHSMRTRTRPVLSLAYVPLVMAIMVHGTYNAMALVMEWLRMF